MSIKKVVILGSTGSIGRATLDVIKKHPGRFDVIALAAYSNAELLAEQCRQFRPRYACLANRNHSDTLRALVNERKTKLLFGEEELVHLTSLNTDIVVNAVVGAAGLRASLATVQNGKTLALANKESLVSGGPLFPEIVKKTGSRILPIDSEHSALWQALSCGKPSEIKRLIITASGGPFRTFPAEKLAEVTPEQALQHPTWKMGSKITIDSATLANKGLEVIEAVALFSVPVERVSVVIHPQSIIHSMVEFIDSSIIAQLSQPDMRLPITYALFWPNRVESDYGQLDLKALHQLTFEQPDMKRFPALRVAFEVARSGGTAPAVFNAANEVAVAGFLRKAIRFTDIADIIFEAVDTIPVVSQPKLDDILDADRQARELAQQIVERNVC